MSNQILIEQLWEGSEFNIYLNKYANSNSSATLKYVVSGVESEQSAVSIVYEAAPSKISDDTGSIPKKSASIEERINTDTWKVSVSYAHGSAYNQTDDEEAEEGNDREDPEVCFQCNAETTHVTRALSQTCVYARSGAMTISNPDAIPIGWNGKAGLESNANGVDIPTSDTREQYTRLMSYDKVRSSAYRRKIASLVGKVNASEFKGWNPGEVMFMGMSYTTPQRGVSKVKVVFDFSIRPNESDAYVCGIPVGDLKGHEYIWAVTGQAYNNGINPVVDYIFKSVVSGYADFSKLGL